MAAAERSEPIKLSLKERYTDLLLARGLNPQVPYMRPFVLRPVSFTARVEGLKPKSITSVQQQGWYQDMLDEPFEPRCVCISSDPNDSMAKYAAAFLMQNAIRKQVRTLPLWHDLMGGFKNPLVESDMSAPSMLIISNVASNSTPIKIEKLRDILEKFSAIPRIVVASGEDPYSFFVKNLRLRMTGVVYLKSSSMKTVEL